MMPAARRTLRPDVRHARAYRQRRYRARQRLGEGVYCVCVKPAVIEALLARGLSEADSRDRNRVAEELAVVLLHTTPIFAVQRAASSCWRSGRPTASPSHRR